MVDVTVEAGESLGRTGDFGWAMYLILEGSVDIVSDGELVATLGPGDLFGEVALLRAGRRMADVVARTQLELRALFTRDFIRLRDELTVIDARLEASS
jgi:CRP-like cAMP-binding protein